MLTKDQYFRLDTQFAQTPALNDGFLASGEHYLLQALLNEFGLYPHSREEAMDLAEELLCQGWDGWDA